jgi:hypothetical protein
MAQDVPRADDTARDVPSADPVHILATASRGGS